MAAVSASRGGSATRHRVLRAQQNFQRLLQCTHCTNVVIGSSALRVCSWK
jgi:hypothetical protein